MNIYLEIGGRFSPLAARPWLCGCCGIPAPALQPGLR